MIDHDHPVIAIVPDGLGAEAMKPVLERLSDRGADIAVFGGSDSSGLGTVASTWGARGVTEELHPVVDIIPLRAAGAGDDPGARVRPGLPAGPEQGHRDAVTRTGPRSRPLPVT